LQLPRLRCLRKGRGYERYGSIVFYRVWIEDRCLCGHCYGSQHPATALRFPADAAVARRSELANAPVPPRVDTKDWRAFIATVVICVQGARRGRPNWSRARLWYEPHLERIHEDAIVRLADLIQLEQIASGYPSRERFLPS
jgi:hypothetical protein